MKTGGYIALYLFGLFYNPILCASDNHVFQGKKRYVPYFEIGGARYFNQSSNVAGIYNFFIPLLQSEDQIFFTDLRIFDRSGSSFEGNVHLGYRKLYLDAKQIFGFYGAFDRKRSNARNNFNQLTFGFEYWCDKWFGGGNLYKPIGVTQKLIGEEKTQELLENGRNIDVIKIDSKRYDKIPSGFDTQIGYAFTDNLTCYIGGYYFAASDASTVVGPRARLTYDYRKPNGRLLGVLDGVSIEIGAQHDKPRGSTAYVGVRFKIGLTNSGKNSNIFGFERHMIELVRRDPDIVDQQITVKSQDVTRYEILDESSVDESKLAWLVNRYLNIDEIFGASNSLQPGYIPFVTSNRVIKHFAILLTNDGKFVVYYDNDSFVHGLPEDRNNSKKQSDSNRLYERAQLGTFEVGFDNDLMLRALRSTAISWDKNSSGWNGNEYDLFNHNCQNFVSKVMDEYSQHKRIYLRSFSYFKMYD